MLKSRFFRRQRDKSIRTTLAVARLGKTAGIEKGHAVFFIISADMGMPV